MGSLFSQTATLRKGVRITDEEFAQLRDFICDKCGIYVDVKRKYLFENRFSKRLAQLGLKNFSEYIKYLAFDRNKDEVDNHLFELVTTKETSFFRDMKQLTAFKDTVLVKMLMQQRLKGGRELNIWSAGCSSGEEPFTLVILLSEILGDELAEWKITITAVDLSHEMIARAEKGVFNSYAMKTTSPEICRKYFREVDNGWKLAPAIRKMVDFSQMNLNDAEALKAVPSSHIVFCRNVLVYFDDAMKQRMAEAFFANLLPGGCLMTGHAEPLEDISHEFKTVSYPGTVVYMKEK